ncbi:MAG: hypothetical protein AAGI25_16075 [Bacteroidota bacterium]
MKRLFFYSVIVHVLIACSTPSNEIKVDSETEILLNNPKVPLNHMVGNKELADSLSSFNKRLKKNFNSNYIISADFRYSINGDSITIYLSQIINMSEISRTYPTYLVYVDETPVFIFTGYERLIEMPQSFLDTVKKISKEKLVDDGINEDGEIKPPATYTPIINKFSLSLR